jgi:DNA-binding CsgD family transcriptional regulator
MSIGVQVDKYNDAFRTDEIGMIEAIACWCECLQGQTPLRSGLRRIAEGIGAEAIALSRSSRMQGGASRTVVFDRQGDSAGVERLERSYAGCVLGPYLGKPKPGTIWFHSMCETDGDPALSNFHRRRHLSELAVIPLAVEDKTVDFLEIHFAERLAPAHHAMLNMMLSTLTRTWARRSKGLFSEVILQPSADADLVAQPILSANNPARLSRAEYRVCHLLSRGLSTKAVQAELTISGSTLRTHLRNIYAKTRTKNQSELLFQLLAAPPLQPAVMAASRVA